MNSEKFVRIVEILGRGGGGVKSPPLGIEKRRSGGVVMILKFVNSPESQIYCSCGENVK